MEAILVVATDLGVFRAFRRAKRARDSQAHLEPVAEAIFDEASAPITGQFPKAASAQTVMGDMTHGEQHNYGLEQRKRALQTWATRLHQLLAGAEYAECWLAAPPAVHQQLIEALDPLTRAKVRKLLPRDLARIPPHELLDHFE